MREHERATKEFRTGSKAREWGMKTGRTAGKGLAKEVEFLTEREQQVQRSWGERVLGMHKEWQNVGMTGAE